MHFKGKDPVDEKFTTTNPYTRKPMVFLLDPSVSKSAVMMMMMMIDYIMMINESLNTGVSSG